MGENANLHEGANGVKMVTEEPNIQHFAETIKEVDEDALVGYIMRNAKEQRGINLMYEDVRVVLDMELEFLKGEGIAE